ncbi:YkgJ family cysteine cluster protein [Natronolimnobius sp. AArcel1]|uniref:YkgJ family cysteine cluster protein n=1 Tax=Natronolimnobius sp. AArcel1 TaxID=1679093 RepID=UPI0013EE3D6E|nr:YkgJ family cysteine cluster protein [Natronolimnobius sp. AArcel1]NGM68623.1 YkgJ family cysteine cluster protein [Natronolimnobius sp. AArcel1]
MEVNCEGCAGCCMDWRPLLAEAGDDESANKRRAAPLRDDATRAPLDGDTNFVPLTRDEVRAFLEAGMADALTPRFWRAADEHEAVEIDGYEIASVADRPVFFVGLRKPPKPVAPFDLEAESWLPACVFLNPTTLQCRIHDSDLLPDECSAYPAHNIALEQETECERVEAAFGGDRLVDDSVPEDLDGLLLGSQALGEKLFCHPEPEKLEGVIERTASGELTREDRADCLAIAAASSAGTMAISEYHYEWGREQALEESDSWVTGVLEEWESRHENSTTVPAAAVADAVETDRGAPETPGWDSLE